MLSVKSRLSSRAAFERTLRAPPPSFATAARVRATVGATVRFQRGYDGKQRAIRQAQRRFLHIASLSDPPLRLLLGRDAYDAAEKHVLEMLESDRKWKDLSVRPTTNCRWPGRE